MKSSPTQRSLELMRRLGYRCAIVQHWNPHAMIRQDLFGIIDILCVHPVLRQTVGVQATTGKNVAARVAKIKESDAFEDLRAAGWSVVVHGWTKGGPRGARKIWALREIQVI